MYNKNVRGREFAVEFLAALNILWHKNGGREGTTNLCQFAPTVAPVKGSILFIEEEEEKKSFFVELKRIAVTAFTWNF